jgi:hypothetical protein
MSWVLTENDPWYLDTLLAAGATVPADAARAMLDNATGSRNQPMLKVLARHGLSD